jgi:hypothetical protein
MPARLRPPNCRRSHGGGKSQSRSISSTDRALDRRTQDQARALDIAQQDAQSAQQTTQRLETEFNTWRTELNLVRQAIQDQSHADLQALDELNSVLEQLVPASSRFDPFLHDQSHMATGQSGSPTMNARRCVLAACC